MSNLNETYPWSTVVRIHDTIGGVVHHGAGVDVSAISRTTSTGPRPASTRCCIT